MQRRVAAMAQAGTPRRRAKSGSGAPPASATLLIESAKLSVIGACVATEQKSP
jgi:hypothetical protein